MTVFYGPDAPSAVNCVQKTSAMESYVYRVPVTGTGDSINFIFFLRTELCLLSPASTPAVSRNFTHTLTLLTLLLHPYWEPDTSDPRHFGTETLRTQDISALRHFGPLVWTLRT